MRSAFTFAPLRVTQKGFAPNPFKIGAQTPPRVHPGQLVELRPAEATRASQKAQELRKSAEI